MHGANFHCHRPSACVREASRPGGVVEIPGPLVAGGIQRSEPAANVLAVTQMVIADGWTHPSRSTVDHQPEATVLIAL